MPCCDQHGPFPSIHALSDLPWFERRGGRTILADLASRAPYLAQRALHCDEALPDLAWVYVVSTAGCVLQGDRMQLTVTAPPLQVTSVADIQISGSFSPPAGITTIEICAVDPGTVSV